MFKVSFSGSVLFAVLLYVVSWQASAVVDLHEFNSELERERYLVLIEEMRCPKCQNQNLAGSDSPIAEDLRREIYRLLDEGKTDQEIVDFMVARYGEYVLYRPRFQQSTLILWGLPLALLALGVVLLLIMGRRRRATEVADTLSDTESARLQALKDAAKKRDE